MEDVIEAGAVFLILSALLQAGIQYIREWIPKLDGKVVVLFAGALGIGLAFLFPGAQVAAPILKMTVPMPIDVVVSGLMIAFGSKWLKDRLKALMFNIEKSPADPKLP